MKNVSALSLDTLFFIFPIPISFTIHSLQNLLILQDDGNRFNSTFRFTYLCSNLLLCGRRLLLYYAENCHLF